jgi:hypothetical protein
MASLHSTRGGAQALPLPAMLATIPSLPRPVLARLVARMIDRLDELDGDPDLEPEEDRCSANEDWPIRGARRVGRIGFDGRRGAECDDAEEGGDHEVTDEREPELYDGGHPDIPPRTGGWMYVTA